MTPEDWQRVRPILESALELDVASRIGFLDKVCPDPSLRREVESLLSANDEARSSILQSLSIEHLALGIGTRLGDYEVLSVLGSGGMGEVYRARDLRLDRDVAIKVLPSFLCSDAKRMRRFEQEARATAALNHPNILAVHQMATYEGAPYLVSELLQGATLREELKRGPLPLSIALDYGVQIARGLTAAHEKGIVHRDLKPENLFVTKNGLVKILDFGLAKLTQCYHGSEHSSTTLGSETEAGVVLGTVGYMAPEQVRGEAADHRADIFAFGVILYEMLAGKRAFQKLTPPETMTAILNETPSDISKVVPNLSTAWQRVVQRCLAKDPEQRFQSASDLAGELGALSDPRVSIARARPGLARFRGYVAAGALIAALLIAGFYYRSHLGKPLLVTDTIVLADFVNSTGDAIFDDTLKTALNVSLRQSPFLNVLPDSEVARTLQQMTKPGNTKLTQEVAREVCLRAGSKAYLAGSIGSLGSEYVLGLKAVNCQSGDTLAQEQVTATSKEMVLDTLGESASKLRHELGESLATVQKFDVPLEQATTSSLEALKVYSLGQKAHTEKGSAAAIPYHQRAIELDPNFATGYSAMASDYFNLDEVDRAREYYTKAFQLRQRASERERLTITANYYFFATGELGKAAQTYQEEIESYPQSSAAYEDLGNVFASLGQYEKASDFTRQALRFASPDVGWNDTLATWTIALQRFDEARRIIHEAQAQKHDTYGLHNSLYTLAFLRADSSAMAEQQEWYAGKPEYQSFGLALQSNTLAYPGCLRQARELTRRAVDSAVRADNKENAALLQADAALQQTAYGYAAEARRTAAEALKISPASQGVEIETALAFSMAGDTTRAEALASDLERRFPLDTQTQSLWLPTIQAQLALNRKNSASALSILQTAIPIDLGNVITTPVGISCLYSVYVRGEAYFVAGQGSAAATEFQKIIDHSGIVGNCWTGALAYLGLARANVLQSRTSQGPDADAARVRAMAAYKVFLALWKDADSDIPILKETKVEYARLQ